MATQVMVPQIQLHIWDVNTGELSITLPNLLYISPKKGSYEADRAKNGGPPLKTILYDSQFELINADELQEWWTEGIKAPAIYNHTPPENVADEKPIVIFYWPIALVRQWRFINVGHMSALITILTYISNWPGKDKLLQSTKGFQIKALHKDIKLEGGLPLAFQFEPNGINIQLIAEQWKDSIGKIDWNLIRGDNCGQTVAKCLQSGGLTEPQVINNSVGQYLKKMMFRSTLRPISNLISIQSSVAEKISRDAIKESARLVAGNVLFEVMKDIFWDPLFVKANRGIDNIQLVINIIQQSSSRGSDQIVRYIEQNVGQYIYEGLNNKVNIKLRKKARQQFTMKVGQCVSNAISQNLDQAMSKDASSEINHMINERYDAKLKQMMKYFEEKNYSNNYVLPVGWFGLIQIFNQIYLKELTKAIEESARLSYDI